MQIECHRDATIFESIAHEWNALASSSLTNTPFQRAEFQNVWWRHLGEGQLCVLTMRESPGGKLAAVAPVFVDGGGVVRWVGGEEIADYLDVIAPAEAMEAALAAAWQWLNSADAPTWSRIILSNIPGWTPTPQRLKALAAGAGLPAEVKQIDVCPVVQLPATFDDYLNQVGSKQRREIRRKLRRSESGEIPVEWYIVDSSRDISAETESFLELMAAASPEKAAFLTPAMRKTFRELFPVMQQAGLLQLAFLEVGGAKAAAYAQFDYADRVWVYNSGINAEDVGALSPGWVLLARLIEHAIAQGRKVYDFMQGGEDYKYRFGGKDTAVFRLTVSR